MYQISDCFLYGREGVCTITDIVTRKIKGEEKKVLCPCSPGPSYYYFYTY